MAAEYVDSYSASHVFMYLPCLVFVQVRADVSVFEFNIRFAGGILSAYALSGDEVRQHSLLIGVEV